MDIHRDNYPKSANNFNCLGPCYRQGMYIVHPITLKHVTNNDFNFCPVNEWEYQDPDTGKKEIRSTDKCFDPVHNKSISNLELAMNIIVPKVDFTCDHFLKIYYNIYSMEAAIEWLENNREHPFNTQKRVLDCAWKVYGFNNYILDDRLVNYYIDIIKERYIDRIYKRFYKFIKIASSGPKLELNKDKDSRKEKIDYIKDKMINYANFNRFLTQYISRFANKKDAVRSHTDNIINMFIEYLEKKIDISMK